MEEEKIDRILKLVDMLEVTDENRDDIAKLIEQKKYAEMLEVLKKVTSKNETKIKEDNRTILFRNEEKEENKEEKEPIEEDDDVNSEEDEKAQMEKLLDNLEQEKEDEDYEYPKKLSNKKLEEVYISLLLANPKAISMYYIEKKDCYFESALLLNIYKSILFTEGEAYAPQVAKDDFNYAKENYKIIVSGEHGSSAYGLNLLLNNKTEPEYFIKKHLMPVAQEEFSRQIAENSTEDYAMMDTSDGLADALMQIAQASKVSLIIDSSKIPHAPQVDMETVLYGGEDYQLVAAVPEHLLKKLDAYTIIGEVKNGNTGLIIDGKVYTDIDEKLYKHFKE